MTWHYDIADDASSMDIYDHTGSNVSTVQNDGSGFEIPGDVLDVMATELDTALSNNNIDRAVRIARDAAMEQLEAGVP